MEHKRLTLFAGHYGSGKTNIAVNYAMHLAEEGKKVCIADLDIVNPYFRTKDSAKVLEQAGVKPIEAVGCEFNPDFHNAVMHVEDEEAGENIVVEEFQKGYMYKESVVRHSMVKVAN